MSYSPEIIKSAEELVDKMYLANPDNNRHRLSRARETKIDDNFKLAVKSAIITLEFSKSEFGKSIGACILDGVFEDEYDSGVDMLKIYIRDFEKQINYLTENYSL